MILPWYCHDLAKNLDIKKGDNISTTLKGYNGKNIFLWRTQLPVGHQYPNHADFITFLADLDELDITPRGKR